MEFRILKKKIGIEKQIDDFLDKVSESGLLFKDGIQAYLKGKQDAFKMKLEQMTNTERIGDRLRRSLEEQLYRQTLIPESRGDVLELLESMDTLLNQFKGALWRFDIEYPEVCEEFKEDFIELTDTVVSSVECIVLSCRAFFKDINSVTDHMHKVSFWEKQSDVISIRLQKAVFKRDDLRLSHRTQICDFVKHIDTIANRAEDVADRLSIYAIKRSY